MNSEQKKLCIKYKLFNKLIIINKSIYKTINMHNFEKTKTYLGSTVWFWAGNGPSDPAPVETSCFRFRKYKLCHIVFLLKVACSLPLYIRSRWYQHTQNITNRPPHQTPDRCLLEASPSLIFTSFCPFCRLAN